MLKLMRNNRNAGHAIHGLAGDPGSEKEGRAA